MMKTIRSKVSDKFIERNIKGGAVCLALALLTLSGCKSLGEVTESKQFTKPDGVTVMSEAELRSNMVGNTIDGKSLKGPLYTEFYAPDGKGKGVWDGNKYKFEYAISGPVYCYKGDGFNGCNLLELSGDDITWYGLDGKKTSSAKLLPGNAKDL
jgi:hypothetical protein